MLNYFLCALYVIFSVTGLTLVKVGSGAGLEKSFVIPGINMTVSIISFIGLVCYGISFCLYMGVVSKFDLGIIIPILGGIVNILILLVACFILKEKLTTNMIIGAVIIIIGIFIMNVKK